MKPAAAPDLPASSQALPLWARALLVVLIVAAAVWRLGALGLQMTDITPEKIRAFVLSYNGWAPAVYLLIYGQPLVPLPASVMGMTAGLAFGPLWGMLAALIGATMRACTQFGIARWIGRETMAKFLRGRAARLHRRIGRHGFHAVLLIRLIPNVPYDMQNYGLGFSRVLFRPYALATLLGVIPASFAFAYLGDSLTDLRQLWKFLLAVLVVAGLVFAQHVLSRRQTPAA